jgi:membrane protease subunit HflK
MPLNSNNNDNKGPWGRPAQGNGSGKKPTPPQNEDLEKLFSDARDKIHKLFSDKRSGGKGFNGGGSSPFNEKKIYGLLAAIPFFIWMASGFYIVDANEVGVTLRLGEYSRTTNPGLNYHLPNPIEKVIKIDYTKRYTSQIGGGQIQENSRSSRRAENESLSDKTMLMLTGDENLVNVSLEVQWQIANAEKYIFNVRDQEKTVIDSAESAMREVIGTTPLNAILSTNRKDVQDSTKALLQSMLNSYDIGIEVEGINMRATPPANSISVESITTDENGNMVNEAITTTVDEAFKDVQAAIINKEATINSAIARSNELIPQSRGSAERLLQEAQGYKEKVIADAEGDAKRFNAVYEEYKNAKTVTKQRMYLETMEKILSGTDKIILDSKGANSVVPYLPLNELKKTKE